MSTTDRPAGYTTGRPTPYRPEMCEQVIEWGKLGKSRAWMAAQLDITYMTLLNWEKSYPEFFDALARAEMKAQQHWEDLGHENIRERDFNSSVWSRSMAARFPKMWREKTAHVGGDEDDSPIKQEVSFGADAFTRAIAGLASRSGEDGETGSSES